VNSTFHSYMRPTTLLAQLLIAVNTVCCRQRNLIWDSASFLQAYFTRYFSRFDNGSFSSVYKLLDKEMMLQTAKSIWWYLKLLSTHGARCVITRTFVPEMTLKTFEAESVKTWQRLWVVEDFQTDGTRCEIRGHWCCCRHDSSTTSAAAIRQTCRFMASVDFLDQICMQY